MYKVHFHVFRLIVSFTHSDLQDAETSVGIEREVAESWARKAAEAEARIKKHEETSCEASELALEAAKREDLEAELKRLEEAARVVREKINSSKERSAMLQTRMQAKETKQQQRKERKAEMEKNLPTEEKKKEWAQRLSVRLDESCISLIHLPL